MKPVVPSSAHSSPATPRGLEAPILLRARRGDPVATRQLIDHHAPAVFGLLSRLLEPAGHGQFVEDLAQETMLRVVRALPRFDPDGAATLSTWILTIATRLGLKHLQRRRLTVVEAEPGALPSTAATPEAQLSAAQLRDQVRGIVAAMSPQLRAAFVLTEAFGMTPTEVAGALEIPPTTARTRIHRARLQIREALRRGGFQ